MKKLEIAFAKTAAEAEKFMCQGYCPVECSYGGVSIVDNLDMDHHGVTADGRDLSKLESVAIRAYRDCYGKRYQDPRFVISHIDADCTFAIASLAGYIPSAANKNNLERQNGGNHESRFFSFGRNNRAFGYRPRRIRPYGIALW